MKGIQNTYRHNAGTRGFSLVEMLIVLALIGLIGGFVSTVYLFSDRLIGEWKKSLQLENELHTLLHGVSENLYQADKINKVENMQLHVSMSDTLQYQYMVENGQLIRNDKVLTAQGFSIVAFEITSHPPASLSSQLLRKEPLISDIKAITIEMGLTNGEDTLTSKRVVHLRSPSTWKPLTFE